MSIKAKIITLKGNYDSEKNAAQCIERARLFGINVEHFDAIDGYSYPEHLKKLGIRPKYIFKGGRPGVYGCFLSHYYLWRDCVNDNIPYLILEHDGYFIRPLPQNFLGTFQDVLKLDDEDPFSEEYSNEVTKAKPFSIKKYHNSQTKLTEKNGTGNYMRGAYGYIIKPNAAKKILDWIEVFGFVAADTQIGSNIVDIRVTVPTVVRLHPCYQDKILELSLTRNSIHLLT